MKTRSRRFATCGKRSKAVPVLYDRVRKRMRSRDAEAEDVALPCVPAFLLTKSADLRSNAHVGTAEIAKEVQKIPLQDFCPLQALSSELADFDPCCGIYAMIAGADDARKLACESDKSIDGRMASRKVKDNLVLVAHSSTSKEPRLELLVPHCRNTRAPSFMAATLDVLCATTLVQDGLLAFPTIGQILGMPDHEKCSPAEEHGVDHSPDLSFLCAKEESQAGALLHIPDLPRKVNPNAGLMLTLIRRSCDVFHTDRDDGKSLALGSDLRIWDCVCPQLARGPEENEPHQKHGRKQSMDLSLDSRHSTEIKYADLLQVPLLSSHTKSSSLVVAAIRTLRATRLPHSQDKKSSMELTLSLVEREVSLMNRLSADIMVLSEDDVLLDLGSVPRLRTSQDLDGRICIGVLRKQLTHADTSSGLTQMYLDWTPIQPQGDLTLQNENRCLRRDGRHAQTKPVLEKRKSTTASMTHAKCSLSPSAYGIFVRSHKARDGHDQTGRKRYPLSAHKKASPKRNALFSLDASLENKAKTCAKEAQETIEVSLSAVQEEALMDIHKDYQRVLKHNESWEGISLTRFHLSEREGIYKVKQKLSSVPPENACEREGHLCCLILRQTAIGLIEYGLHFAHKVLVYNVEKMASKYPNVKAICASSIASMCEKIQRDDPLRGPKERRLTERIEQIRRSPKPAKILILADYEAFFTITQCLSRTGISFRQMPGTGAWSQDDQPHSMSGADVTCLLSNCERADSIPMATFTHVFLYADAAEFKQKLCDGIAACRTTPALISFKMVSSRANPSTPASDEVSSCKLSAPIANEDSGNATVPDSNSDLTRRGKRRMTTKLYEESRAALPYPPAMPSPPTQDPNDGVTPLNLSGSCGEQACEPADSFELGDIFFRPKPRQTERPFAAKRKNPSPSVDADFPSFADSIAHGQSVGRRLVRGGLADAFEPRTAPLDLSFAPADPSSPQSLLKSMVTNEYDVSSDEGDDAGILAPRPSIRQVESYTVVQRGPNQYRHAYNAIATTSVEWDSKSILNNWSRYRQQRGQGSAASALEGRRKRRRRAWGVGR